MKRLLLVGALMISLGSVKAQYIPVTNLTAYSLLSSNKTYSLITNVLASFVFKVQITNLSVNFDSSNFTVINTNIFLKYPGTNAVMNWMTNPITLSNVATIYNSSWLLTNSVSSNSIQLLSSGAINMSGNLTSSNNLIAKTITASSGYGAQGIYGLTTNVPFIVGGTKSGSYYTALSTNYLNFKGGILTGVTTN